MNGGGEISHSGTSSFTKTRESCELTFSPYRPKVTAKVFYNMNLSFMIWTIDGYRLEPYPYRM